MPKIDPIRPTDDDARALARTLLARERHAALGVIDPDMGTPMVTRIAFGTTADQKPISLISDLSHHTRALRANPACSLLIGEPDAKGDPLTHPRLTLQATAMFVPRPGTDYDRIAGRYLETHPKSKLYIGFGDFNFVVFDVTRAFLNGGFGRAFVLSPDDLLA